MKDFLRVLVDGGCAGAWNMAVDESLLRGAGTDWGNTVRFYRWRRPTVSLGFGQPWRSGYDPALRLRERVDLVRRPTGGAAVLHVEDLSYSLSAPRHGGPLPTGLRSSYRVVSGALATGLRDLGAPVRLAEGEGTRGLDGGVCFATRTAGDLVAEGRKLAAVAQRRRRHRLLQQGSIAIGDPRPGLWRVLGPEGEGAAACSISLDRLLVERPAWRRLVYVLAARLAAALALRPVFGVLGCREVRLAKALVRRYRDPLFVRRC